MVSSLKFWSGLLCWYENPFVLREMHLSRRRRGAIWLGLGAQVVLTALTFFVVALTTRVWMTHSPARGIGPAWGGSVGALCLIPVSLLIAFFVWRAAGSRSGDWIGREVAQGTLQMLLVTPMTPTEMVLKRAAWPFVNAMLAALVGLPFVVLCASMGGVTFWTIVSLYVVFAALAIAESGPGSGRPGAAGIFRGSAFFAIVAVVLLVDGIKTGFTTRSNPLAVFVLAAEFLARSQQFFGFHLPPLAPLLFVAPMWLAATALAWSWRVYDDQRILIAIGRCRSAFMMTLSLVLLGYLWPHLVAGGLGWAAQMLGATGMAAALRGTLLILLAIAVLVTGSETLQARYVTLGTDVLWGRPPDPDVGIRRQLYLSAMGVLSSVAPPVALYAVGCVFAGENPLQIGPDFLGAAMVAALASVFYTFGLGVTVWACLSGRRGSQYGVGIGLFVVLLALPIAAVLLPIGPEAKQWMATFAPLGGLMTLADSASWAVHAPLWRVIAVQTALGALFALGGLAVWEYRIEMYERRAQAAAVGHPDLARSWARRWFMRLWAGIVRAVQSRWDNPVFVREVRVASRRSAWPGAVSFVILALVLLLWAAIRNPLAFGILAAGFPFMDYVTNLPPPIGALAAIAPIVLMVAVVISFFVPTLGAASHLARERRRGTLAFTLATPMPAHEIISGAAAAALVPAVMVIGVAAVPCLALTVLSLSLDGWLLAVTLIMWAVAVSIAGTGVALGFAGLYNFRHTAESSAGLGAILLVGMIELVRIVIMSLMAHDFGLVTYLPIWVSFGVETLAGVAGYAIAVDRLRSLQSSDLPTEHEWLPPQ